MMRKALLSVVIASAAGLLPTAAALAQAGPGPSGPPPLPAARKIPGVNADDQFGAGCVGCHVNHPEMNLDVRLGTLMRQWNAQVEPKLLVKARAAAAAGVEVKGRHPLVPAALDDIPGACLTCHAKEGGVGIPFARLLHLIHLTGGDENHFMTLFQGECTHCHKLDAATGRWWFASGPES